MSSVVKQEELAETERTESDEFGVDREFLFKVTSPEGTDELYSPDEVTDLISDLVTEQFWDWWNDPARRHGRIGCRGDECQQASCDKNCRARQSAHGGRFKPRVKVYEVLQ